MATLESEMQSLAAPFVHAAVDSASSGIDCGAGRLMVADAHGVHLPAVELTAEVWQLAVSTANIWSPCVDAHLLAKFLQVSSDFDGLRSNPSPNPNPSCVPGGQLAACLDPDSPGLIARAKSRHPHLLLSQHYHSLSSSSTADSPPPSHPHSTVSWQT